MVRSGVEEVVVEALREVQRLGDHPWAGLPVEAPVIGSLEGFDSLTGIEATVLVETKLTQKAGQAVVLGMDSIFVTADGRRALSLGEVVSAVCAAMGVAA